MKNVSFFTALISLFIILIIMTGCTSSRSTQNTSKELSSKDANSSSARITQNGGSSVKKEEPPLKIIIYTDFQCGACSKLNSEVEPQLRLFEDSGMAKIETRIVGALGEDSMLAGEAALCAADQGKFHEYLDALFSKWRQDEDDPYAKEKLIELAASLGMDANAMRLCLDNKSKRSLLEKNLSMARADGVNTLPAVFINGNKIEGYKPLERYIQAIDRAISEL